MAYNFKNMKEKITEDQSGTIIREKQIRQQLVTSVSRYKAIISRTSTQKMLLINEN